MERKVPRSQVGDGDADAAAPPPPPAGPVLGIETSCDETACAILDADGTILAERVASQIADHAAFGGVVPEIAARAHLALLPGLLREALGEAGLAPGDLACVAATVGPGLIGGLLVGSNVAKGMALAAGVPFVGINHLEAHALTPRLPALADAAPPGFHQAGFPYVLLLVSGGHTALIEVGGVGRYRALGTTLDDAAGEAFDKVAKLLGLPYPGGPALERLAGEGMAGRIALPRPMVGRPGCDFSFSGLKTAVAQHVARQPAGPLERGFAADLARGFQDSVIASLADRLGHALEAAPLARAVVVAGGVAANQAIRAALGGIAAAHGLAFRAPPLGLCTDNAVMVAWAAIERGRAGLGPSPLAQTCRPRWPLATLREASVHVRQ